MFSCEFFEFFWQQCFPRASQDGNISVFTNGFVCLLILIFIRDGQIFGGKKIEALVCKTERIKERKRNTKKIKQKNFHLYYFLCYLSKNTFFTVIVFPGKVFWRRTSFCPIISVPQKFVNPLMFGGNKKVKHTSTNLQFSALYKLRGVWAGNM